MAGTITLEGLYRPVQEALDKVGCHVREQWAAVVALLNGESAKALLGGKGAHHGASSLNGGKMLRPALCLLSAGALGTKDLEHFVPLAASLEMLHLAALTHDDVIDGSNLRRGARSVNATWTDRVAVLSGDYLVARSLGLLKPYESYAIVEEMTGAVRQMTEGELFSFGHQGRPFTQEQCIEVACKKTASLFAASCTTPALVKGAHRDALREYGLALGVAFQLVDDVLDLTRDEHALGKPSCGDLVEGKATLPILLLREALDEKGRARLDAMKGAAITTHDRQWVADLAVRTGARQQTEAMARQYADRARTAIAPLPPSRYKDSMIGLTEFVVVRGC